MVVEDIYFAYGMLAQVAFATLLYGVRVATRGAAQSERVSSIGGTALVGRSIMDWAYWALAPILRGLVAVGLTPNGATWTSLVLGVGAGVAAGFSMWGLTCLLAVWATLFDILDGQIARVTKSGSQGGEVLDAAVDRYTEFALLVGCVFAFRNEPWILGLVLSAMLACFMVSYASAKAEAMNVDVPRGLMRRHERATYLLTGAGLTSLLGPTLHAQFPALRADVLLIAAMAIVGVIGNVATVQRFVRITRALR